MQAPVETRRFKTEQGESKLDREKFISQVSVSEEDVDMQWITDVLKQSVESNKKEGTQRGHRNLIIVMEELSELSKEISKKLRGKGDQIHILEELADVQLGIYYVQEICGISNEDLHKAMNVKTRRLEETLKEKGMYR